MKRTNLNIFYQMGQALGYLCAGNLRTGQDPVDLYLTLTFPRKWSKDFLDETTEYEQYLEDPGRRLLTF